MDRFSIINCDCRDAMRAMPEASVHSIVTDPPYGLSFMGKEWDHGVPGREFWEIALRVAKPGAHLLAFGGTRTFHRLVCAIEDAGWDIRDCIMWVYGTGFPKSHNLDGDWDGWGTALKPAWEPIIVARKPLDGTVAANMAQHGTGALNIDGCRIGTTKRVPWSPSSGRNSQSMSGALGANDKSMGGHNPNQGRWPANLIHDGSEEVVERFPSDAGAGGPASGPTLRGENTSNSRGKFNGLPSGTAPAFHGDAGSAARFFYCAKASKKDRDDGCEALLLKPAGGMSGRHDGSMGSVTMSRNTHATVKPTDLMRYLCRLVTPPDGVVLDPFMGSGSTGKAAMREGFRFIGCEVSAEYVEIARARIAAASTEPPHA